MLTANKLIPQGRGLAPALKQRAARVALSWDTRQKSRFEATDSAGRRIGVFLPRGSVVRGGDVLVLEDGALLAVEAAPEPVLVVRPCRDHGRPDDLLRAAYHLGNRHIAVELHTDHLKLEPDHVLASLLRSMHLEVEATQAAFEPESGAYAAGAAAGHGHTHDHDSGSPAHRRPVGVAVAAAPHVHGPGCGHDHPARR